MTGAGDEESTTVLALKALWLQALRIHELEHAIDEAVAELRAEHRPEGNPGKAPWGCLICYPADSSWPCVSRLIADDLAAARGCDPLEEAEQ